MWLAILAFYVRHRDRARTEDPLVATLLGVLALDALKSVVENVFFGIVWARNYGIAFSTLGAILSRAEFLIIPKLFNTFVAIAVVTVVIRRWIPAELAARRERETQRTELLDALAKSLAETAAKEERWQLALEATSDGTFDLDISRDALWLSPRYLETLGLDGAPHATRADLIEHADPEDRPRLAAFLDALIDDAAAPSEIELRQRTKDDRRRIVALRIAAVRDENGHAKRLVGTQSDLTERRAAEEALAARQRTESLGLLAGGIAHDFNNLLAVMKANAEVVRRSAKDPDAMMDLEDAIGRATDLTARLLAYSGRGRFVLTNVDMSALASDLVRLFRSSAPTNVRIEANVTEGLPPVFGDVAQLQQVVMNLLKNAIDAIEGSDGSVTVSTGLEELAEGEVATGQLEVPAGRYVTLTVEDTGCGMSEATRARVFEPFFTTKSGGHGLGMAAILGILRAHRGGMRLRSAVSQGTTFTVLLPPSETPSLTASASTAPAKLHAQRALVVDDDKMVARATGRLVERLGYAVDEALDGTTALEMLAAREYSLVVLDLTMPGLDGRAVLERLRARLPELPVILVSGYATEARPESPHTCFLAKPFTSDSLRECLRTLVGDAAELSKT